MKKALILGVLITLNAQAGHLDTVCESAVNAQPIFDSNYVARRSNGMFVLETLSGTQVTNTAASIRSIVREGASIWVLTANQIVELDTTGEVLESYDLEQSGNPSWYGLSMIQFNRKLVISRGAAGVTAFDMDTREFVWTNWFAGTDDGFPSGLATDGRVIYAASATSHQNGFTGIVSLNPESGAIIRHTPYDVRRSGVLDTNVKARMHGEDLVLNNGGWIHLITKKQIESEKAIRPRWVAHMMPAEGPVGVHYMMIAGDFLMHDGQVMACGTYTAFEEGQYLRKSKLFHVKLPSI